MNSHWAGRLATTTAVILVSLQAYMYLNNHLPPRFDLTTAFDRAVPFVPWTLLVYLSFYVMLLWAAWVCSAQEYLRLLAAVLCANAIAYLGFIFVTAHYPRPDCSGIEPAWLRAAYVSMFAQDAPGNTFPSLHVTVTALVALRLRTRPYGVAWIAWGTLVVLSTLTVKQHFVADALGGIALALGTNAWFFRRQL